VFASAWLLERSGAAAGGCDRYRRRDVGNAAGAGVCVERLTRGELTVRVFPAAARDHRARGREGRSCVASPRAEELWASASAWSVEG
jgi:hypothetical protein